MNRNKVMKFFMIMLPPMAFGLATTVDSLVVFDSVSGVTSYYSYFQQVPGVPMALLAAVAGILCIPGLILAVIAAVKDSVWAVAALKWVSFASASISSSLKPPINTAFIFIFSNPASNAA